MQGHGEKLRKDSSLLVDFAQLSTRNPRLLLRLEGVFLLRLATRALDALLFQLPPRLTRFDEPRVFVYSLPTF